MYICSEQIYGRKIQSKGIILCKCGVFGVRFCADDGYSGSEFVVVGYEADMI